MDAPVGEALALQALAGAGLDQEVPRPLLDEAGADATFDVIAAAIFEDDGLDAFAVQEMRKHQPRGTRADDADLRAHAPSLSVLL